MTGVLRIYKYWFLKGKFEILYDIDRIYHSKN